MPKKKEITLELTNYCPNACKYCSSNSINDKKQATFLSVDKIKEIVGANHFNRIILSGGEPLSHPYFYDILQIAKKLADDVVVYTNELTHVIYNANVIDGIYVAANITINNSVDQVKILKRTKQGRESTRPEVTFSGNYDDKCPCDAPVVLPSGDIVKSPCAKDQKMMRE